MIAGLDEAGKGPVLGPMCVAGVMFDEKDLDALVKTGVRDSKQLSPKKRDAIAVEVKDLAERYYILEVSPVEIDELRKVMTMNEIMVVCYAKVFEELKPDRAFVDAADVIAERFGENIKKKYTGKVDIISEHNADENYPIVSAASILAKVRRDELVRKIGSNMGIDIGSGYPADPKTIKFLEDWVKEYQELPDFARSSWKTSKNIMERMSQRTFSDY